MGVAGCSSADVPQTEDDAASEWEVAGSSETRAELGVARWVMKSDDAGHTEIVGLDGDAATRMEFAIAVQPESASSYRMTIRTKVDGRTANAYAVADTQGAVSVIGNELRGNEAVARALARFGADFKEPESGPALTGDGDSSGGSTLVGSGASSLQPNDLVADPGQELVCDWHPGANKLVAVFKCGTAIVSCGGMVAAPEIAPVDVAHCSGATLRCGESVTEVIESKEPHYECSQMKCDPCSQSEPSLYPGTSTRNPSSSQRSCYNYELGSYTSGCSSGDCPSVTDAKIKEWQTTCGCNKPCTGGSGAVTYSGGGPKG